MARFKLTKKKGTDAKESLNAFKLTKLILEAIEIIRERRKRPDKDSVTDFICSKHGLDQPGLDKGEVIDTIDGLLLSGMIFARTTKGKESYFISEEAKLKMTSDIGNTGPPVESGVQLPTTDCTSSNGTASPSIAPKKTNDCSIIEISEVSKPNYSNITHSHSNSLKILERNSFITRLSEISSCDDVDYEAIPRMDINEFAHVILQLNNQLQLERQRCDDLKYENLSLKTKLFQYKHTSTRGTGSEIVADTSGSTKMKAIEKIQEQWVTYLEDRRKKYEQHKIASKLNSVNNKNQISKGSLSSQLPNRPATTEEKVDKFTCAAREIQITKVNQPVKRCSEVKLNSLKESRLTNPDGQMNGNIKQSYVEQESHAWKKGTVLILGDSMLHGIDEKKLSKNGLVKVRCFPGSTINEMKNFYMQPLLCKKPSKVILHVGTNDAAFKESTADSILDGLLETKKEIESKLPKATVVLSTPVYRTDQMRAGKIVAALNKKIRCLGLNIVDNNNLGLKEIGRKGLHLNGNGVSKLASNLAAKLRSF